MKTGMRIQGATNNVTPIGPVEVKKVTKDELLRLTEIANKRSTLSSRLGEITYELKMLEGQVVQQIATLVEEQRVLGTMMIRNAGLDPESKDYVIDFGTGEITEAK